MSIMGAAAAGALAGAIDSITPSLVRSLDPAVQEAVKVSYNDALAPVFLTIVPLFALGFVLLLFLKERPLAATNEQSGHMGEGE